MTGDNGINGLKSALTASLIAHILLAVAAIALYSAPRKKLFSTAAYTIVSIAAHSSAKPAPTRPSSAPPEKLIKTKGVGPNDAPKTAKTAPKAIKETAKPVKTDVNAAIKKIEHKVQKERAIERERTSVSSAIESIKKRQRGKPGEGGALLAIKSAGKEEGAPIAGTAQSKAQTVTGPANTSLTQENLSARYPAYYALIRDRVQENWKYPFQDDRVLVTVSMKIDKAGTLLDVTLEKGSGNALLDASLINAVKKAAPFPALPHGFEGDFLETGLRFCQGCTE